MNGSWIGREVEMAAHDGSEHAERAEQRDIGDATLEQLRSDVIRLSHGYMTGEPFRNVPGDAPGPGPDVRGA